MDGWVDGWVEGKAGLRIAYSNQKVKQYTLKPSNNGCLQLHRSIKNRISVFGSQWSLPSFPFRCVRD
jgi:hypothetical protein